MWIHQKKKSSLWILKSWTFFWKKEKKIDYMLSNCLMLQNLIKMCYDNKTVSSLQGKQICLFFYQQDQTFVDQLHKIAIKCSVMLGIIHSSLTALIKY